MSHKQNLDMGWRREGRGEMGRGRGEGEEGNSKGAIGLVTHTTYQRRKH